MDNSGELTQKQKRFVIAARQAEDWVNNLPDEEFFLFCKMSEQEQLRMLRRGLATRAFTDSATNTLQMGVLFG